MFSFFQRTSIRNKLLAVILLSGVPVVLTVVLLLYGEYRADYLKARLDAVVTVRTIAAQQSAQVEGFRSLFNALAEHPAVRRKDKSACNRLLRELLHRNPSTSNVGIADAEGNLIASAVQPLPQKLAIGDRKYFRDAIRTGSFSVGEFALSREQGKAALHFAQPVLDRSGRPLAVIYAVQDLSRFDTFFTHQGFPAGCNLTITDHRGIILHSYPGIKGLHVGKPDRADVAAKMAGAVDEGTFVETGLDGVKKLFAFKKVALQQGGAPYMYIRVTIPHAVAMAKVNRYIVTSLAVFFLAAALTAGFSNRLASRYLATPLEQLAAAAHEVAAGNLSVRTSLSSHDELGILSRSFDAMTESLGERLREKDLAEARLKASEEKFKAIFDHLNDAIFIHELGSGRIIQVNQAMCEMYGYTAAEAAGLTIAEISLGEAPYTMGQAMHLMEQAERGVPQLFEWQAKHRDGSLFWVEVNMRRAMIGNGEAIIVAARDITERKAVEAEKKTLQEQLTQAQKMESVGRLAGGIAHDFNNLLTPIIGFAELAAREVTDDGNTRPKIERIIQASLRAKDLVQQLLSFSRKQVLDMQVIDLNGVISSFHHILRRTVSERIDIRLQLAGDLGGIHADRTNIEQLLMNLLVNAQDAIEGAGMVTIETGEVFLDEEYTRLHNETVPGRYALLAVTDTGAGISKEDLPHVFEPFFSTKETGKGSGLGLATVYGIVKQHGGSIWVYSEENKGTVFKMYFPIAEAMPAVVEKPAVQPVCSRRGKGTLLLVEDEELVRIMLKELLVGIGYKVIDAGHPRQALQMAEGRQIDLLLTDVVMPEMAGPELHKRLLAVQPGLKVIFMSGYTDKVVVQMVQEADLGSFIQKPFTVEAITARIAASMAAA